VGEGQHVIGFIGHHHNTVVRMKINGAIFHLGLLGIKRSSQVHFIPTALNASMAVGGRLDDLQFRVSVDSSSARGNFRGSNRSYSDYPWAKRRQHSESDRRFGSRDSVLLKFAFAKRRGTSEMCKGWR
jgi:hypothetical protein